MNFGLIMSNQNVGKIQKLCYMGTVKVISYMDTDSLIVHVKQKIFIKTLQRILKQDLTFQIQNYADHYLKEKNKKVTELMKDELGEQIMKEFVEL